MATDTWITETRYTGLRAENTTITITLSIFLWICKLMISNQSRIIKISVESLRPNGVYEFRVRGRNADGVGVASKSSGPSHIKVFFWITIDQVIF